MDRKGKKNKEVKKRGDVAAGQKNRGAQMRKEEKKKCRRGDRAW